MEQNQATISTRQFVAMGLLMIGAKLSDDTPTIIFDHVQNAAWMVPLFTGIISIIPLYFLLKVMGLYPGKNLHDIHLQLFGRFFGFLLSFGLWVIGSSAIVFDSRSYADIIGTMYFTKTPTMVIYAVLMLVCVYGAKKGIGNIASVSWLLLFYVKILLFIAFMLTIKEGTFNNIFPIWGPGKWEIIKQSGLKISIFADLFFLALIAPYVKSTKAFKKGTWITLGFLVFELSLSFFLYLIMFDYIPVQMLNYPFHETIRYISIGKFLTNIETLFFPIWLIATFVRFAAYLYLSAILFGGIFKIKKFELLIPTLATVFLLLGLLPSSPSFTTYVIRDKLLNIISPMFFSLPILLWLTAKIKGEFKREQSA